MTGERIRRINEALREEISAIIQRELKDPRLGLVTITAVEASPDLKHARVFITRHDGKEELEIALSILRSAAGLVRGELGKRLRLKFVPELTFIEDETIEAGIRIGKIIGKIHEREEKHETEG